MKPIFLMLVGALALSTSALADDTGMQTQIQADITLPDGRTASARWQNRIFDNEDACKALLKAGYKADGTPDEEFAAALIDLDQKLPAGTTIKFSCVPLVQGQNSI